MRWAMLAAAMMLAACETSGSYTAQPRRQMDPNTAAMMWMMYSNQMTDSVVRARQQPAPQVYCYQSGGMSWCQ